MLKKTWMSGLYERRTKRWPYRPLSEEPSVRLFLEDRDVEVRQRLRHVSRLNELLLAHHEALGDSVLEKEMPRMRDTKQR